MALAFSLTPADAGADPRPDAERRPHAVGTGLDVVLHLPHSGPYRATLLADPPRLAIDLEAEMAPERLGRQFQHRPLEDGRVRLETALPGAMALDGSAMAMVGQGVQLTLRLSRVASSDFAARIPDPPEPVRHRAGQDRLTIALDPGHGGHDPGAIHGALHEADLMLAFAQELKADLLRMTEFDVVLTRSEDRFIPLTRRQAIARRAGADLFLSLHADGIANGSASGATVFAHGFTHGADPANSSENDLTAALASHALPAGADRNLPAMPAGRSGTLYRSQELAAALVSAMARAGLPLYKHPRQQADFVVLRGDDIPSALVEIGFLSEAEDRARIADPGWRARMAASLRQGVLRWAQQDAAIASLRLQ